LADPSETAVLGRQLIDAFAEGWSKARLDLICSVFADEAVFIETPFSSPLQGLPAIRRWWADVPYHQSEITCTTGEVYTAGPWFSTEFKVRFRRRRTGDWVEARGAMFCETAGGKISEMRMYWHRWSGGREI
jgi:ketosteroid isomerase-like protein